jgi:hypothetical protein
VGGAGRRLLLNSEDEIDVIMDYAIYELGAPGTRVIDRYRERTGGRDPIERELLDAMAASAVGVYRVQSIDQQTCQLTLKQLAPAARDIIVTDINFSQSPLQGAVFFTRLLELPDSTMTGGAALMFEAAMQSKVSRLWAQSVPHERYPRIFKLHRRSGVPMAYASVEVQTRASQGDAATETDE